MAVRGARTAKAGGKPSAAAFTVERLQALLDEIAPARFAAEWDNVGLLAGRAEWPAARVLLAIDLTDAVAREALRERTDALVVYHPPIFKGIRSITPRSEAPTTMLPDLLASRVSIIALHTALDAAPGGTNDQLLDLFDCARRYPLVDQFESEKSFKLVTFAPPADLDRLRRGMSEAGAGIIGHYSECSFETPGQGTFLGDETTRPTVGRRGVLERVDEVRLEMVVPAARLGAVVRALYAHHSYEEPAFDVYPLREPLGRGQAGMGRVGVLRRPQRGTALVSKLRSRVDLSAATVVGSLTRTFPRVVAAAGSFGPRALRDPDALVLTGELKHHEALELLGRGVTAVCLGHYTSERPVLNSVLRTLRARAPGIRVGISRADAPPLRALPE